jgi:GNAT superfamily N-acetyltransferase
MTLELRELQGDAEYAAIYPLIQLLNPEMTEAEFHALLPEMRPLGYGCVAAFEGTAMVGLCGFWRRTQFWNRRSLQLDNLVVAESHRSAGLGAQLMRWLEALARAEGRQMLVLDSYVHNHASHKLYFREGYIIQGYHFTKKLD